MKKLFLIANLLWMFSASSLFQTASADVPATNCRSGYTQQGWRLCMSGGRGPDNFLNASFYCQNEGGRLATEQDWYYRRWAGDKLQAPVGWWLGNTGTDDSVLFVNDSKFWNFEGNANKADSRYYTCVHDKKYSFD
jgi:hypothetical protein